MKYRDLQFTFKIEDVQFTILSICLEKLIDPMPMHSHSKNSYEIHYISYGYGTLYSKGKKYDITPGTLFVTGPQIEHEQISLPENPMTEYCIYLKVNLPGKKRQREGNLTDTFLKYPFWFGMGDNVIHELMKQMIWELENKEDGYELMLQTKLMQFILLLIRKYGPKKAAAPTTPAVCEKKQTSNPANPPVTDREFTPALANSTISKEELTYLIIEEAFLYDYKEITLETLAKQVGLSKRQTERLLQLHYHKTFLQKKTEARMSAACSLLRDSSLSVSQIAQKLGYSSVEHFSNAFKRYHKETPSAYRKLFSFANQK